MRLPFSTAVLGTCCLFLLVSLGQVWLQTDGGHLQVKEAVWTPPTAIPPAISLPATASGPAPSPVLYMASLDRPLFAPNRRAPPPPDAVVPAPPPDPFAEVQLLGLLTGELWSGAILSQNGKIRRIQMGQSLADWTLTSIDQRNATFSRNEETRVLALMRKKAPVPTALRAPVTAPVSATAAVPVDVEDENRARMNRLQQLLKQQNR